MEMKKKMIRLKKFVSLLMAFVIFQQQFIFTHANENTIYISTAKDLLNLEKNCRLDTWSKNKIVILKNDIDLSNTNFKCIPTFAGTFDGQSHKIFGLSILQSVSAFGFFRYVQEGAIIKNLEIDSTLTPAGSKKYIGGICSKNFGTIQNCIYNGTINAKNYVGGISAVNELTGEIISCTSAGKIYGEHYTGGVCGENLGQIISSVNNANVNNKPLNIKMNIHDVNLNNLVSFENSPEVTDIGGICGYSSGVIENCKNNSQVGYLHVGYNIGGIVGCQICYVNNCVNNGQVFGRKDVGGICGQMEPYVTLKYSPDSLDTISNQLSKLQNSFDSTLKNIKNVRQETLNKISSTRQTVSNAQKYINDMLEQSKNFANDNVQSINSAVNQITDFSNDIIPILKNLSQSAHNMTNIIREYKTAFEKLDAAHDAIDTKKILNALDRLSDASKNFYEAIDYLIQTMDLLKINTSDFSNFQAALQNISNANDKLLDALQNLTLSVETVKAAVEMLIEKIKSGSIDFKKDIQIFLDTLLKMLNSSQANFEEIIRALKILKRNSDTFINYISDMNPQDLKKCSDNIKQSLSRMRDAFEQMSSSLQYFSQSVKEISTASDLLKESLNSARQTSDKLVDEFEKAISFTDELVNKIEAFTAKPILQLEKIDDKFIDNKNKLSDALKNISDTVFDISDSLNTKQDGVNNNLENLSAQTFNLLNSVIDAINEFENKSVDPKDYVEDISDIENNSPAKGKIQACTNFSAVSGDINVGGIAGSMDIEYDFDPEEDIVKDKNKSLNFIYQNQNIINLCKNYGDVESKKDYAGGIAGKSEIGAIFNSTASSSVTSKNGNYVGGIVGSSKFLVKNCAAKSILSGKNYVGGIAGFAHNILSSKSLPCIKDSNEFIGAISGDIDGKCEDCYFVNENLGAIDNISYEKKAQPLSYDKFVLLTGLPDELKHFTISFWVGKKNIKQIKVDYGSNLDKKYIPAVPNKENYFGKWNTETFRNIKHDYKVEAVYSNYKNAIESNIKRGTGLPIFIAQGKFKSNAKLKIKNLTPNKMSDMKTENWSVDISGNVDKKTILHYKPPADMNNVTVKTFENGKWENKKIKHDGGYIVFEINSPHAEICVKKNWFLFF